MAETFGMSSAQGMLLAQHSVTAQQAVVDVVRSYGGFCAVPTKGTT